MTTKYNEAQITALIQRFLPKTTINPSLINLELLKSHFATRTDSQLDVITAYVDNDSYESYEAIEFIASRFIVGGDLRTTILAGIDFTRDMSPPPISSDVLYGNFQFFYNTTKNMSKWVLKAETSTSDYKAMREHEFHFKANLREFRRTINGLHTENHIDSDALADMDRKSNRTDIEAKMAICSKKVYGKRATIKKGESTRQNKYFPGYYAIMHLENDNITPERIELYFKSDTPIVITDFKKSTAKGAKAPTHFSIYDPTGLAKQIAMQGLDYEDHLADLKRLTDNNPIVKFHDLIRNAVNPIKDELSKQASNVAILTSRSNYLSATCDSLTREKEELSKERKEMKAQIQLLLKTCEGLTAELGEIKSQTQPVTAKTNLRVVK